MVGQKEHKRKLAKMMARNKDKDIPFEETSLGMLSAKLQTLMAVRAMAKPRNGTTRKLKALASGGQPLTDENEMSATPQEAQLINSAISKLQEKKQSTSISPKTLPGTSMYNYEMSSRKVTRSKSDLSIQMGSWTPASSGSPTRTPAPSRVSSAHSRRPRSSMPSIQTGLSTPPLKAIPVQRPITAYEPSRNKRDH